MCLRTEISCIRREIKGWETVFTLILSEKHRFPFENNTPAFHWWRLQVTRLTILPQFFQTGAWCEPRTWPCLLRFFPFRIRMQERWRRSCSRLSFHSASYFHETPLPSGASRSYLLSTKYRKVIHNGNFFLSLFPILFVEKRLHKTCYNMFLTSVFQGCPAVLSCLPWHPFTLHQKLVTFAVIWIKDNKNRIE